MIARMAWSNAPIATGIHPLPDSVITWKIHAGSDPRPPIRSRIGVTPSHFVHWRSISTPPVILPRAPSTYAGNTGPPAPARDHHRPVGTRNPTPDHIPHRRGFRRGRRHLFPGTQRTPLTDPTRLAHLRAETPAPPSSTNAPAPSAPAGAIALQCPPPVGRPIPEAQTEAVRPVEQVPARLWRTVRTDTSLRMLVEYVNGIWVQ